MAASQSQMATPDVAPSPPEVSGGGAGLVGQQAVGNQAMIDRLGLVSPRGRTGAGSGAPAGPGAQAATAPAAAVVDGSSVVLARGTDTSRGNVLALSSRIASIASDWHQPFAATQVQTAQDAGQTVVVLQWAPAWGEMPRARETLSWNFAPIEARFAVAAARASAGWARLDADGKARLEALVGGEANDLSRVARQTFAASVRGAEWARRTPEEQERTFNTIITAKVAEPSVVSEPNRATPAAYTLTGPRLERNHAFRGQTADADVYEVKIGETQTVTIYAPHTPDPALQNHTVQQAAESIARVPEASRKLVRSITLNSVVNPEDAYWAQQYHDPNFHSYMTAGAAGDVSIYPGHGAPPGQDQMAGSMIHETGHTWSYKTWGEDTTRGGWVQWRAAMTADRTSVSGYAQNAIAEDVAETIDVYGATRGTPAFAEYQRIVPNRFRILDEQLR